MENHVAISEPPWKKSYYFRPGLLLPCIMNKKNIEENVKNFEVRDDDVFILTYPKAGTNWMCEIVECINYSDNLEHILNQGMMEKMPLLEFGPSDHHPDLVNDGITGVPSMIEGLLNNMPSPRRISTHLLPDLMPTQFFIKKPKCIYVQRNPKDIIVSLLGWHHSTKFLEPIEWDQIITEYMQENTEYGSYFEYTKQWAKYLNEPWVYSLKYEDILKDHKGSIKGIAEFLGHSLSDEKLDKLTHLTSFNVMKENIMKIKDREFFLRADGHWQRKGKKGDWRHYFTVAQSEEFDKVYAEKMQGYENLMCNCKT